ncbi:hypothetical protein I6F37_43370, partial [Bradyrhizobium sp. NBAIM08]|nr:hypothetical protein [Bradyrhizobium sp. NBAIM08]
MDATIRAVVTATNAGGSTPANSAQTVVIAGIAPSNSVVPTISGTVTQGQTLTAANGTWAGTPAPAYTYQWQRCDQSGASCVNIAGATAGTYVLTGLDANRTVRVRVTGTNTCTTGCGAVTANSVA